MQFIKKWWSGWWGTAATSKVKVSAVDTTEDYLSAKLVAWTNITLVPSGAGNETLTVNASGWVLSDEKVKYDAADPTAGYVVDKVIAWTWITVAEWTWADENKLKITNTAPDQTVAISSGTWISATGTYPNFTVTNTAPDQTVAITWGTGISTWGTYPNLTVTNTAPDQTVAITDSGIAVVTGTYPNFNIDVPATDISGKLDKIVATDSLFTTGILDNTKSTIAFDNSSHIFTIAPTSWTFDIYLSGVKYAKSTCTVDLDTVGLVTNTLYYIYFDGNGNLQGMTTAWDILSNAAPVATIYWNWTTWALQDERHNANRNLSWHERAHDTIWTRYQSWLDQTYTTSTLAVTAWYIDDEDLELYIAPQTTALIRYIAAWWTKVTFDSTPSTVAAKIVWWALKYDWNWTLTSVTSWYYMRTWIYATNDKANPIYVTVWQREFQYLNDARTNSRLSLPNMPTNEMRLIGRCIRQNVGWTPTFVEYTDYRNAIQDVVSWWVAITPRFLDDNLDVTVPSPAVDDLLAWNWNQWINKAGHTVSGSAGIEFFQATPVIDAVGSENTNFLATLSKTPVTTAEQTLATNTAAANTPILHWAWLYDTALGRTSLDAWVWDFTTYAWTSSVANGRVVTLVRQIYSVLPQDWASYTITMTGTGTSRTATCSAGWTPFATTKIDASATNTTASFLQTPKWLYQITARTSDTVVTIAVPTGYSNESTVTFNVWKKLFGSTSPSITAITPAYAEYNHTSVQWAFTVTALHKLGSIWFANSTTANANTLTTTYNGTARNTHIQTPLITLHNNLAGLQGGWANDYQHLTTTQLTALWNAVPNTRNLTINWTTYDLSADRTWTVSWAADTNIKRFVIQNM